MNFTLRQITYFLAIARHGSFGRAAEAVHVSQPGLSSQLARLEAQLGGPLFQRGAGPGPVRLTALGERLLPIARELADTAQRLQGAARSGQAVLSGRLRLAIIPTVAPYLIPRLVPLLRARHPSLSLELHEVVTDQIAAGLAERRYDAGVMALPVDVGAEGIEAIPVLRDRFLVAAAQDDPLCPAEPVAPEAIAPDRLLLLADGHCLRDQALAVCGLARRGGAVRLEAASMATLMRMVEAGMGITLIPELALRDEDRAGKLALRRFADPAPARDLAVVWRRNADAGRDARALAALIREIAPLLGVSALEPSPGGAGGGGGR